MFYSTRPIAYLLHVHVEWHNYHSGPEISQSTLVIPIHTCHQNYYLSEWISHIYLYTLTCITKKSTPAFKTCAFCITYPTKKRKRGHVENGIQESTKTSNQHFAKKNIILSHYKFMSNYTIMIHSSESIGLSYIWSASKNKIHKTSGVKRTPPFPATIYVRYSFNGLQIYRRRDPSLQINACVSPFRERGMPSITVCLVTSTNYTII